MLLICLKFNFVFVLWLNILMFIFNFCFFLLIFVIIFLRLEKVFLIIFIVLFSVIFKFDWWVFMLIECKMWLIFFCNKGVGLLLVLCEFIKLVMFGVLWIIY